MHLLPRFLFVLLLFIGMESYLFFYIDVPIFRFFQGLEKQYPFIKSGFEVYTNLGLGIGHAVTSVGLILIFLLIKRFKTLTERMRDKINLLLAQTSFFFVATSFAGLLSTSLKPFFGRTRPSLLLNKEIYDISPFTITAKWNSMPSGHTATAFAASIALILLFPRLKGWPLLFGISIALSRLVISAHYLSDTLAGAALAALCVSLTYRFFVRKGWLPT